MKNIIRKCKECNMSTMHYQKTTSHVLHLLLSVITAGIWIPMWFLVAWSNSTQKQCSVCGSK